MKLQSKESIMKTQQQSNALGTRLTSKDLTISKPLLRNRMPVIQLSADPTNIKNYKGTINHINRLSTFHFS